MEARRSEHSKQSMREWIDAIRAGDRDAFTELYQATHQEVYRTVRAILHSEELAQDVQQDTYIYAYTHLDQLNDPEKIRPWLRSIAVNRARSLLRKQNPVLFSELETEDDASLPEQADCSPEASPELSLERKETTALVNEILAGLSDGQRAAVAMYYYEQMPVAEIAKSLGVSSSTVKNQLARGRKKIEEAVRALERQGVKLYGLSPLPFLLALLKQQSLPARENEALLAKTLSEAGLAASVSVAAGSGAAAGVGIAAGKAVAVHVGRPFFETAVGKLILGVICVGVVSGSALGYRWVKDAAEKKTAPILNVSTDEAIQDDTTAPTVPMETEALLATDLMETEALLATDPVETTESATKPTERPKTGQTWYGTCGAEGDNLRWTLDSETGILTISGSGEMADYGAADLPWHSYHIDVHTVILEDGVTSIGDCAFLDCINLEHVTIPDGVTRIGYSAFDACSQLTSLAIPASVTDISGNIFWDCSALSEINVDPDNPNYCSEDGVLYEKEEITFAAYPEGTLSLVAYPAGKPDASFTVPSSVMYVDAGAFTDCPFLTAINVDPNNKRYSSLDGVLFDKKKTTLICYPPGKPDTSYTVPDNVTSIDYFSFHGCSALTQVTIPDSVTEIGDSAFTNCICLQQVTIPDSVTSIGDSAFWGCSALTNVTIPDSVTSIDNETFYACRSLTSMTIPGSVTSVGDYAFCDCIALKSVTIPASVTEIGQNAFGQLYYVKTAAFTIHGEAGTAAEAYAEENGFPFVVE